MHSQSIPPGANPPPAGAGDIWPRGKIIPWLRWDGKDWVPDDEPPPGPRTPELDGISGVRLVHCASPDDDADFGNLARFKQLRGEPIALTVVSRPAAWTIGEVEADFEPGGKLRELRWREVNGEARLAQGEGQDGFRALAGNSDQSPLHSVDREPEVLGAAEDCHGPEQGDGEIEGAGAGDQKPVPLSTFVGIVGEQRDLSLESPDPRDLIVGQLSDHSTAPSTTEESGQC